MRAAGGAGGQAKGQEQKTYIFERKIHKIYRINKAEFLKEFHGSAVSCKYTAGAQFSSSFLIRADVLIKRVGDFSSAVICSKLEHSCAAPAHLPLSGGI